MIVTRESDPKEIAVLRHLCGTCAGSRSESEWLQSLGNLPIGEAAALPITTESKGEVTRIRLTPRLTPHIRHAAKYIDLPVSEAESIRFLEERGNLWQTSAKPP